MYSISYVTCSIFSNQYLSCTSINVATGLQIRSIVKVTLLLFYDLHINSLIMLYILLQFPLCFDTQNKDVQSKCTAFTHIMAERNMAAAAKRVAQRQRGPRNVLSVLFMCYSICCFMI